MYTESMCLVGGQAGSLLAYAKGSIRLESGRIIDMEILSGIFTQALKAATSCMCINERFDYLAPETLLKGMSTVPMSYLMTHRRRGILTGEDSSGT